MEYLALLRRYFDEILESEKVFFNKLPRSYEVIFALCCAELYSEYIERVLRNALHLSNRYHYDFHNIIQNSVSLNTYVIEYLTASVRLPSHRQTLPTIYTNTYLKHRQTMICKSSLISFAVEKSNTILIQISKNIIESLEYRRKINYNDFKITKSSHYMYWRMQCRTSI
jgi:hypothetical protein